MSLGDLGFKKVRNSREDNDIKSTKMMKMFFFCEGRGGREQKIKYVKYTNFFPLPDCLITSGAIQKGVPTKVFRLLVVFVS